MTHSSAPTTRKHNDANIHKNMKAPSNLDATAKKLWDTICKEIHVTPAMGETLAKFCNNTSIYWQCDKRIKAEGFTVETERGGTKYHPLFPIMNQAEDRVCKAAKLLGLSSTIRPVEDVDPIAEAAQRKLDHQKEQK